MSAPVFIAPVEALASAVAGAVVHLAGPEGRHAVSVRRLGVGEAVEVVDGAGRRVTGVVRDAVARDRLSVEVSAVTDEPVPDPRLVVVQALPKGERSELAVELLTEVGVDVVVPWAARRCVARWRGERAGRGVQRWAAVAREAAKQARRARVPEVLPLAATGDVVALARSAARTLVLHEEATASIAGVDLPERGDVVLVVGPEGGLDPTELGALGDAGGTPVRLGPTVLRTSTAGAVAAALIGVRTGRW